MNKMEKTKLVALLRHGQPLFDALDAVKVEYQRYRKARNADQKFCDDVDHARNLHVLSKRANKTD